MLNSSRRAFAFSTHGGVSNAPALGYAYRRTGERRAGALRSGLAQWCEERVTHVTQVTQMTQVTRARVRKGGRAAFAGQHSEESIYERGGVRESFNWGHSD